MTRIKPARKIIVVLAFGSGFGPRTGMRLSVSNATTLQANALMNFARKLSSSLSNTGGLNNLLIIQSPGYS
jgi:hypothetical protein